MISYLDARLIIVYRFLISNPVNEINLTLGLTYLFRALWSGSIIGLLEEKYKVYSMLGVLYISLM